MIVNAGVLGRPSKEMVVGISAEADLITTTTASDCLVICDMAVGELMCEDDEVHMHDGDKVLVENSRVTCLCPTYDCDELLERAGCVVLIERSLK